jgi:hypothetical protein
VNDNCYQRHRKVSRISANRAICRLATTAALLIQTIRALADKWAFCVE